MGGTGLGTGATIQQGLNYNFNQKSLSTSTTISAYGSAGPFTVGGNVSSAYDFTNKNWYRGWGVNAGIGIGNDHSAVGLIVGFGSEGFSYGLGGFYAPEFREGTRANVRFEERAFDREMRNLNPSELLAFEDPCVTCPPGVSISDLDWSVQLAVAAGGMPFFDEAGAFIGVQMPNGNFVPVDHSVSSRENFTTLAVLGVLPAPVKSLNGVANSVRLVNTSKNGSRVIGIDKFIQFVGRTNARTHSGSGSTYRFSIKYWSKTGGKRGTGGWRHLFDWN